VGFYVNNEYDSPDLQENPPSPHLVTRINRNILAAKPRITTFHNSWDNPTPEIEEVNLIDGEGVEGEAGMPVMIDGEEAMEEEDEEEDDEEEEEDDDEEDDDEEDGEEDIAEGDGEEEDIKDENDIIEMDPNPTNP
jgi:histone chaperone ASF1